MLVLTRKKGEQVVIGDDIFVTVSEISGGKVRLGIEAPQQVKVYRKEIHDNINGKKPAEGGSIYPKEARQ